MFESSYLIEIFWQYSEVLL